MQQLDHQTTYEGHNILGKLDRENVYEETLRLKTSVPPVRLENHLLDQLGHFAGHRFVIDKLFSIRHLSANN